MAVINAFAGNGNIGRDITMAFAVGVDGAAPPAVVQVLTVEYRELTQDITKTLLNARTIVADLPKIWEGTIEYVRTTSADLDNAIGTEEQLWLAQGAADFTTGTLVLTINSPKLGTTTLTFGDVSIRDEGITWKPDDLAVGRLAFRASNRTVG